MNFKCEKCGKENFIVKEKGNQVGLYCSNGHWQKWLSKEEQIIYEEELKNRDNEEMGNVETNLELVLKAIAPLNLDYEVDKENKTITLFLENKD